MQIRDACESDLPALRTLMNHYRQNTHHSWDKRLLTEEQMQAWLIEHSAPPYAALVAEEDGSSIAFPTPALVAGPHFFLHPSDVGMTEGTEDSRRRRSPNGGRREGLRFGSRPPRKPSANRFSLATTFTSPGAAPGEPHSCCPQKNLPT